VIWISPFPCFLRRCTGWLQFDHSPDLSFLFRNTLQAYLYRLWNQDTRINTLCNLFFFNAKVFQLKHFFKKSVKNIPFYFTGELLQNRFLKRVNHSFRSLKDADQDLGQKTYMN
jgi:hypothetical protein